MENKKGIIHAGIIVAIVAVLMVASLGVGYMVYEKNTADVKMSSSGVEVDANGVKVMTGEDGVNVDLDGTSVDVDSGSVNVKTKSGSSANTSGGSETSEEKINNVLIFDASGSMSAQANGGTRIQLAKNAMSKFVDGLKNNVSLSVVAYGHKGNNTLAGKAESCAGIEEIYYMGSVNAGVVKSKVNALNPNGWTPIMDSLKKAEGILQKTTGTKHIVLLSDGEETCGGDPVKYACDLKSRGISVDVIGLDVTGAVAKQLADISKCGGGEYYSVNSSSDFEAVINSMGVKINTGDVKVDISNNGTNVNTGNVNVDATADGAKVDAGNVKVDTTTGGTPDVSVPGVNIPSF